MGFFGTRVARKARAYALGLTLLGLMAGHATAATIDVRFEPAAQTASVADTFDVQIIADIAEPILGFGFELTFDDTLLDLNTTTIGPDFTAALHFETSFFSAVVFPSPISGEGIVLGSAEFTAQAPGTADFGVTVAEGNLTQGFAKTSIGAFADFDVAPGSVTIMAPSAGGGGGDGTGIPEPATFSLLALAAGAVIRRRTR